MRSYGIDSQGGGIAIYVALHDTDKLSEGEMPIWEIIDPEKEKGKVIMGIYAPYYMTPTDKRPHLIFTPKNEKEWFDLYVDQFDRLWSKAKPVDLQQEL